MIKSTSNIQLNANGLSTKDIYLKASGHQNHIYFDSLEVEEGVWTLTGDVQYLVFFPHDFDNLSTEVYPLADYNWKTLEDILEFLKSVEDFHLDDTCKINVWEHEEKLE